MLVNISLMTRRFKFGFVFQVMDTNCSTEEEKEEKEGEGLMPRQVSRGGAESTSR